MQYILITFDPFFCTFVPFFSTSFTLVKNDFILKLSTCSPNLSTFISMYDCFGLLLFVCSLCFSLFSFSFRSQCINQFASLVAITHPFFFYDFDLVIRRCIIANLTFQSDRFVKYSGKYLTTLGKCVTFSSLQTSFSY